ncbi:hypothetical protein BLNAU_8238 [Blattamonas nauphoetae]|uniref:Uncharacterized protein n=1 Tax=Blattamonas nauphoetae TaxID=2049346 RepID=A0ABQ9XZ85_9EUKA|nr:hypothetical protein BLNAU_8238 [Blattamonas nauphoetae]
MLNIVDRIVGLLDSDSCLDDDTILRICAFHKHQLSRIYLPDLFRQAGRSTEQFLHAFECLLSLPIDCFDQAPINHLLPPRPLFTQPTFDEWDDIDFETVGIVKRLINQNHFPVIIDPNNLDTLVHDFVIGIMPHAPHCAARLGHTQFERLLAPSVDRVIAQCLSRTGFFSRFVTAMFDHNFKASEFFFQLIIRCEDVPENDVDDVEIEDLITVQRRVPNFLEEGWQDAMEFLFVKGKDVVSDDTHYRTRQMMLSFGANVNSRRG